MTRRRGARSSRWVLLAAATMFLAPGVVGRDVVPTKSANAAAPTTPPASVPAFVEESAPVRDADVDAHDVLARADAITGVAASPTDAKTTAAAAIDGRDDSAWVGAQDAKAWEWRVAFRAPHHLSLIRARFGRDATKGIPTKMHWEAAAPRLDGTCPVDVDEGAFAPIPDAFDDESLGAVRPTSRSWFVDADACALRLMVTATNGGPPVVREVRAIEGARDVLRGVAVETSPRGDDPAALVDGTYDRGWSGDPVAHRWTITVPVSGGGGAPIDRVHLLLGLDATSRPRPNGVGRVYGIARGPVRYTLEGLPAQGDGKMWITLGGEPHDPSGNPLPIRRRLITFAPRALRAIRLVIDGATDDAGAPDPDAFPVVREISAYRADDKRPLLFAPWILSVNANPAAMSHKDAGERANDVYWTKFLQLRFAPLVPALRRDDRYARLMGPRGQLLDAKRDESSGVALEAIEGDDATLDLPFIEASTPRPIVVLSGSNNWDYARKSGPNRKDDKTWRWDPLLDAKRGGMGQLFHVVAGRAAPLLGFCGGGQILALLEARSRLPETLSDDESAALIERLVRRTTGVSTKKRPPKDAVIHAWPGDGRPRTAVTFDPRDPLFVDVAGLLHRMVTHELPESHVDVVRPSAFVEGGPLDRLRIVAKSVYCTPSIVDGGPLDRAFPNPDGSGRCLVEPEAWRSSGAGYPLVGAQFHAEQFPFPAPATSDPPESTADPWLFVAAEYETIVDAYLRNAP